MRQDGFFLKEKIPVVTDNVRKNNPKIGRNGSVGDWRFGLWKKYLKIRGKCQKETWN